MSWDKLTSVFLCLFLCYLNFLCLYLFLFHECEPGVVARIFPWRGWGGGGGGGGGRAKRIFLEKCSLPVDRLGRTSECYIEVEQKGGGGLGAPLATPLYLAFVLFFCLVYSFKVDVSLD